MMGCIIGCGVDMGTPTSVLIYRSTSFGSWKSCYNTTHHTPTSETLKWSIHILRGIIVGSHIVEVRCTEHTGTTHPTTITICTSPTITQAWAIAGVLEEQHSLLHLLQQYVMSYNITCRIVSWYCCFFSPAFLEAARCSGLYAPSR